MTLRIEVSDGCGGRGFQAEGAPGEGSGSWKSTVALKKAAKLRVAEEVNSPGTRETQDLPLLCSY